MLLLKGCYAENMYYVAYVMDTALSWTTSLPYRWNDTTKDQSSTCDWVKLPIFSEGERDANDSILVCVTKGGELFRLGNWSSARVATLRTAYCWTATVHYGTADVRT